MSRKKELQRSLGNRYSYERLLSDREIQRLKTHIPSDFSETAAAVLYRSCKELLLGYDVFVKDDPASPEWIFYNSLSEPVSLKETDMLRVLDRTAAEHGLSYTESCFDRLDGKSMKKEKPAL